MTYDTTTASTDGALVQNGSKIESSDANQGQGEQQQQQQISSTPRNDATGQERTQAIDISANQGDDEAHENSFAFPSSFSGPPSTSTVSITSDQETTTSKVPLNGSLIEDIDRTSGESSSASSAPGSASSDGRNSFDDDCFMVQQQQNNSAKHDQDKKPVQSCYNPSLDDEIRYRLDKLNALSDLINKLETQFDSFNTVFRETLKCSSHRLTTIAKTIGSKSIQHGRVYHEAKIFVEQIQSDCQRACVQFEQANHDHQFAKEAIKRAELRLKQLNMSTTIHNRVRLETNNNGRAPTTSFEFSDLCRLKLDVDDDDDEHQYEEEAPSKEVKCSGYSKNECDNHDETKGSKTNSPERKKKGLSPADSSSTTIKTTAQSKHESYTGQTHYSTLENGGEQTIAQTRDQVHADAHETEVMNAAKLSEDLNRAINRLIEAEQKRSESEKLHLDQANKLMLAQDTLMKLEREHGNSIRRSQIYFDETKQFNAKLSSLKDDIAKISCEISRAKQSYAKALDELEQFSADLHLNSHNLKNFRVE